jgi:RimJ/RimL family protein N-acetyltransferase
MTFFTVRLAPIFFKWNVKARYQTCLALGQAMLYVCRLTRVLMIDTRARAMDSGFIDFDFTLRDGRAVHIRAMRKSDEAEFLQAFERLSPEALYMRFMRVFGEPNIERLRKALASFPESGLGIVATVPADDGIDIVGSAMFLIGKDPTSCEFATTVAADYGGLGLGRTLVTALIGAAKQRGLHEMEGFVLAKNQPMLKLAARLGFSILPDPDDASVRLCRLHLADNLGGSD